MSNELGSISISLADATRKDTRPASSAESVRRASATRSASGSNASTCAASEASPAVSLPSPQPISSTRRPRSSPRRCSAARWAPRDRERAHRRAAASGL